MPANVYKQLYYDCYLTKLGPVQANLSVYGSTFMNVIGSYVIYHHVHNKPTPDLSFCVIDIKGSVYLSCTDTLALWLVLPSDKMDKKVPSSAKIVISQAVRSNVFAFVKKTQGSSTEQAVNNNKLKPSADNQEVVCTKADLVSLFPDLFSVLFHQTG